MSLALAVAAEFIAANTGYGIEDVAANLTHEANRRMTKLPPGSEEQIINSYFQGKTDNASATVTTISF